MRQNNIERLHLVVEGDVTGVGFRAYVQFHAASMGLTGWVRNRWDDSVEVCAEGARCALEELVTAIAKGPSGAVVKAVTSEWSQATGEYKRFGILHTE